MPQIFEARFGNLDGQHALLEYPQHMRDFFLRLFTKADLPDTAPAGATWDPFVRGWREDNHYIFSITEADLTAARPGMIATRMIAVPLEHASKWSRLESVFAVLHQTNRAYVPEFAIQPIAEEAPLIVSPSLLACVAHHFINEAEPAVIIGQNGFEDLVSALWQKMPPELRQTFSFGFSFTPTDLTPSRVNIAAVPKSCDSRWSSYKFKCSADRPPPSSSDSLAVFLNDAQAREFHEFLHDLKLVFSSFSDCGRFARLWNYWQRRRENDRNLTYALLRSLGTLLPEADNGVPEKEEAMRLAADLLKTGTEEDVLALRSVKSPAFPLKATILGRSVCDWIKSRIRSAHVEDCAGLAKVILAIPASQSPEWQDWVRTGLKEEFKKISPTTAHTIWLIWKDEKTLPEIGAQLPTDTTTEMVLVRTCPTSIPDKLFSPLETWCESRGWVCLIAQTALSHIGFSKAIDLVFTHGNEASRAPAIELLCSAAQPSEVWMSAFAHDGPALIKHAVTAAQSTPSLWVDSCNDVGRWVVLLEAAAKKDPTFLKALDATLVTARLFEAWENGIPVTEGVCDALDHAERLDFSVYQNRRLLWSKLPKRHLSIALSNTLQAWLRDYYFQPPAKPVLEKELAEILFESIQLRFTFPQNSPRLAESGFVLVKTWGREQDCAAWLHAVVSNSSRLDEKFAKEVGEFVATQNWMAVARDAKHYDHDWKRHDVWPIWRAYYNPLSILERIAFDFLSPFSQSHSKPKHSSSKSMADVIFVTALSEEFSAVTAHLADLREQEENGSIYKIGRFHADQTNCVVAVVLTGMGNTNSAFATERALSLFKPTYAFFVGIAGGLKKDLDIGDVVAADKVYGYEAGKADRTFKTRPEATTVSHAAFHRANAVAMDKIWQNRINPAPNHLPKALVKPIAAGEKIVASKRSEEFKRLKETYSDAHGVAMEEHGFCVSVKAHPTVCFAVVRGISDLIEKKEEADAAGSHEVAARHASAFAFEMLAGFMRTR